MSNLTKGVVSQFAAMDDIDRIVREWGAARKPVPELAKALKLYAEVHDHTIEWVTKKAHDALHGLEWQVNHAPLNAALHLPANYTG
jgi:hypothetical protein